MEIKTLVAKAHENAVKHGFWEPPLPFGTAIALIHSELSEALEEERNGNPDVWFACNESDNFICTPQDETECLMYGKESLCKYRSRKPEGVAVEIVADSVYFADAKKESAAGSYAESAMTSEGFEVTDEDIPF